MNGTHSAGKSFHSVQLVRVFPHCWERRRTLWVNTDADPRPWRCDVGCWRAQGVLGALLVRGTRTQSYKPEALRSK
jgi:hypothetical protein